MGHDRGHICPIHSKYTFLTLRLHPFCFQGQDAVDDTGASILLASRLLQPSPGLSSYEGWLRLRSPPGPSATPPPGSQAAAVAMAAKPLYGRRYVLLDPYAQRLAIFAANNPCTQPPLALVGLSGAVAAADSEESAGPATFILWLRIAEDLAACWVPTPTDAGGGGKLHDSAGAGGVWGEEVAVVASGGLRQLVIHAEAADTAARREWLVRLTAAAATSENCNGSSTHQANDVLAAECGGSAGYPAHYQMEGPGGWEGFGGHYGSFNETWADTAAAKPATAHCLPPGAEASSTSTIAGRSTPSNGGAALADCDKGAAQQQQPSTEGCHCISSWIQALFRRRESKSTAKGHPQPQRNAKI
jgi:hypothetical protein